MTLCNSFVSHNTSLQVESTLHLIYTITMATNNDNGGHNVESHRLSKFNSDGKLVKNNHRMQVFDTNLKFNSCFGKEGSGKRIASFPGSPR